MVILKKKQKSYLNNMNDLLKYCSEISEYPVCKWEHYFDIYENYFAKYRNKPVLMLEIGVLAGGSTRMWKSYFHKDSRIVGIDINSSCKELECDGIDIHIGDQNDKNFIESLIEKYGSFDIVLDDGSHINQHQINTFEWLFPHIVDGGIYLIEDTHTSYWKDCNGGYKLPSSCVEYSKHLIDQLNAYFSESNHLKPTYYTNNIESISFHDSIIAFKKQKRKFTPHDVVFYKGKLASEGCIHKKNIIS